MKTKDMFNALMADTLVVTAVSRADATNIVTTMRVYLPSVH